MTPKIPSRRKPPTQAETTTEYLTFLKLLLVVGFCRILVDKGNATRSESRIVVAVAEIRRYGVIWWPEDRRASGRISHFVLIELVRERFDEHVHSSCW